MIFGDYMIVDNEEPLGVSMNIDVEPLLFQASWEGRRNFEVVDNYYDYKVGDLLALKETRLPLREYEAEDKPVTYTGRRRYVTITHIMNLADYYRNTDLLVLSVKPW